jgi:F-type H+-transporting ATPase subunit alpha
MKKVAGTLKLDQAQFRELEAFSKFGSDLDAATKAVLDKGSKNLEILKQGASEPMSVEKQVAIIYIGTKGLLRQVPVNQVKSFEIDFLMRMEMGHASVLDEIRRGIFSDSVTQVLEKTAAEVAMNFIQK